MKRCIDLLILVIVFVGFTGIGHSYGTAPEVPQLAPEAIHATISKHGYVKDSAYVRDRGPESQKLEKYLNDDDFDYEREIRQTNLWDKFVNWFFSLFNINESSAINFLFKEYFWYAVLAALVIFLIYLFFKNEIRSIFYRQGKTSKLKMELLEEDINDIDFKNEIKQAVTQGNYRLAVRLEYLQALKDLNEKELIDWQADKTNKEYVNELAGKPIYQPFRNITKLFNWVWYGDTDLNEQEYTNASTEFNSFRNTLKSGRI